MHPLNDVVTHVHRVRAFGQHLDPVSILIAGRLERLGPPSGAIEQRGSYGLGRASIQVIDYGLNCLADLGRRVLLLQPMAAPEVLDQLATNRRRIVRKPAAVIAQSDYAGARIIRQRLVVVVGQTNERVVDMNCQCIAVRDNGPEMRPGSTADQCDDRLDLGVIRKCFRTWQENCGP